MSSQAQDIAQALTLAMQDDGTALELLKRTLTDNGYKHSLSAANIMLTELPSDAYTFYGALAATHLPITGGDAPNETAHA